MLSRYRVVIISHVVFLDKKDVFGPGHAVSQVLSNNKINHLYLQHALYGKDVSRIININKSKQEKQFKFISFIPSPFSYIAEFFLNLFVIYKYRPRVVIAIDPLNAIAAIIGSKLGFCQNSIFYTADYAVSRFDNKILNNIYHALDRFAINNSTEVWNTSTRILKVRETQGVPNEKNIFIPNSPSYGSFSKFRIKKRIPNSMVLMANFTPAINYKAIINSVYKLKKKYPNITVGLVGGGGSIEKIQNMVKSLKLEKNFKFYGFMAHDDALKIAANYEVGLAPYKKIWSWTEYGDSLKAREYLALGLVVIISKTVSTADDIGKYNAGYSIIVNSKTLSEVIDKIFKNDRIDEMRLNSLRLARKFDLDRIIKKELILKYKI